MDAAQVRDRWEREGFVSPLRVFDAETAAEHRLLTEQNYPFSDCIPKAEQLCTK